MAVSEKKLKNFSCYWWIHCVQVCKQLFFQEKKEWVQWMKQQLPLLCEKSGAIALVGLISD